MPVNRHGSGIVLAKFIRDLKNFKETDLSKSAEA